MKLRILEILAEISFILFLLSKIALIESIIAYVREHFANKISDLIGTKKMVNSTIYKKKSDKLDADSITIAGDPVVSVTD